MIDDTMLASTVPPTGGETIVDNIDDMIDDNIGTDDDTVSTDDDTVLIAADDMGTDDDGMDESADEDEVLIKSDERVKKHGEVFTPRWMVDWMLDQEGVRDALGDPYATFLEPAAGNGNFLVVILERKLAAVDDKWGSVLRDRRGEHGDPAVSVGDAREQYVDMALWVLSSIYGIELMDDNVAESHERMEHIFTSTVGRVTGEMLDPDGDVVRTARLLIRANIIQGNMLTMKTGEDRPIVMSWWNPLWADVDSDGITEDNSDASSEDNSDASVNKSALTATTSDDSHDDSHDDTAPVTAITGLPADTVPALMQRVPFDLAVEKKLQNATPMAQVLGASGGNTARKKRHHHRHGPVAPLYADCAIRMAWHETLDE